MKQACVDTGSLTVEITERREIKFAPNAKLTAFDLEGGLGEDSEGFQLEAFHAPEEPEEGWSGSPGRLIFARTTYIRVDRPVNPSALVAQLKDLCDRRATTPE